MEVFGTGNSQNFTDFAYLVLEISSGNRSETYQKEILSKFRRNIEPHFRNFCFKDIKPIYIEQWHMMLLKKYSTNTVKKLSNILKLIMKKAYANGLCDKDPFIGVDRIKTKMTQKREIYTQQEIKNILKGSTGWFKIFLSVAFGTGMRTGELLALQWTDIDFKSNTITVQRSINHGKIKCTKTGQIRTIQMLKLVKDVLETATRNNIWVFPNKYGKPYSESKNILKYYFKPLLKKLGIKYKSLYSSRHSFISLMLNNGLDLLWVQQMAGHKSSTTTLKYYAKFENKVQKRVKKANKLVA